MKRLFLFFCLLLGCDSERPPLPPPAPEPQEAPPEETVPSRPFAPADEEALGAIVTATNTFAANLYEKVRASEGNLALSPASVAVALGMTYAGARGETAAEMKEALALGAIPEPHAAFGTLLRSWDIDPKMPFSLDVANRLFAAEGFELRPAFVSLTADYYRAPVEQVPFVTDPDAARERINGWVAEKTKEKIESLLPPGSIDPSTRLVLTNAVYFRGTWASTFDEKATRDAPFYAPSGEVAVPTMHQKAHFQYAEVDGAKLLQMPYRGGRWAMAIALPDARDGLGALEERYARGELAAWVDKLERFEVTVALPRFRIAPSEPLALSGALEALGMVAVFDPNRADLRGIGEPPPGQNLVLSQVFHKAFVEVDEKGTEAAAATGAVVSVTSLPMPGPEPKTFTADHPFLFFIRDVQSGSVLFAGRLVSPR